jgi:YYY domain-containing protein
MTHFLAWYLIITLAGLAAFPLAYALLPGLAGRGYAFARSLALLLWGWLFWMLGSLGFLQNNPGGMLLSLGAVAAASGYAFSRIDRAELRAWWAQHRGMVIVVEALFLAAFAGWTLVRAMNPEITATEKPMELAFLNAILRSPAFPPRDPWLSGYAISYYYFGFVIVSIPAALAGTPGGIAFNLGIAMVFALAAVGAYGALYALLNAGKSEGETETGTAEPPILTGGVSNKPYAIPNTFSPLLAPLFILLISNFEGFLDMLHARGAFWLQDAQTGALTSRFWTWLNLKDLVNPPSQPFSFIPSRFLWWWRASRVVNDLSFAGSQQEVIDEFPFFSFLLSDLHPHVMAIPFVLLAIALALNYFLRQEKGILQVAQYQLPISAVDFFLAALALGALAFLNTWDFPIYVALFAGAYTLRRAQEAGWSLRRAADFIGIGFLLGLAGAILYFPFYLGFSSQAGGLLPNVINPTRGAHLWIMFGTLFIPILMALIAHAWRARAALGDGFSWGFGIALGLWLLSLLIVLVVGLSPERAAEALSAFGAPDAATLMREAFARRIMGIGGFLTLATLLSLALAFLLPKRGASVLPAAPPSVHFSALMVGIGTLLILAPEFIYLRDLFGTRMNTVFKFYYQAWILLGLAAAWGAAEIFRRGRGWGGVFACLLLLVMMAGLVYPSLSLATKTDGFADRGLTLDGTLHGAYLSPDDRAAATWLMTAPDGVLVEAVDGSYSSGARIATHTGLPNVIGWVFHQGQWRGGYEEVGSRESDVEQIYLSGNWEEVRALLDRYDVRYVYVGPLERRLYAVNEGKFRRNLEVVFEQGAVVIYAYAGGD